mmetsp:Transcript_7910/g.12114  ORF Transcript_7910/g.12114 Transcript_7910/m.12114 type:complete len:417 (-) Transcript_7910:58-1308(-)
MMIINSPFASTVRLLWALVILLTPRAGAFLLQPSSTLPTASTSQSGVNHHYRLERNVAGNLLRDPKTSFVSLRASGGSVEGFVSGLDSALGNPGNGGMSAAEYATPDSGMLPVVVASVLLLSVVAFFLFGSDQSQETSSDQSFAAVLGSDENMDFTAAKITVDQEEDLPESKTEEESEISEEPMTIDTEPQEAEKMVAESELKEERRLREEVESELKANASNLEKSQSLLEQEKTLRQETETKFDTLTMETNELKKKYEEAQTALLRKTEELERTQAELKEKLRLLEEKESKLIEFTEVNRDLEDKYELEQNEKDRANIKLNETSADLKTTQTKLTSVSRSLSQVEGELRATKSLLDSSSRDLEKLGKERKSLRKLAQNMWKVSKTRAKKRFQNVGNRLKRSKKDDSKQQGTNDSK